MNRMKVRTRLTILATTLIVFAVVLGELGLFNMNRTIASLETVYMDRVVPMRDLKRVADLYAVNIVDTAHKVRAGTLGRDEGIRNVEAAEAEIAAIWKAYKATRLIPQEEALIGELEPMMRASTPALVRLKGAIRDSNPYELVRFAEQDLYPLIDPLSDKFSALIEVQLEEAQRQFETAQSQASWARNSSLALIALAALAGAGLSYAIVRGLQRQLGAEPGEVSAVAGRIAEGHLDQTIALRDGDESSVMAAMKRMQDALHGVVGGINQAAQRISAAAVQLTTSGDEAQQVSESQSEAAAAMAAAMEQMAVSISHISDNAHDAQGLASDAGNSASHGHSVVESAASEMVRVADLVSESAKTIDRLAEESDNIGTIVGVIREIADQTNLLALNAAIEAARAGEQGRGFAVVADEVRKLAERTAQSTGEIVGLVNSIQGESRAAKEQMQAGTAQVGRSRQLSAEAGEAIARIRQVIDDALRSVRSISESLEEQRSTSSLVANQVETVAQGADENAASVRSIVDAARDLNHVAADLTSTMARFRL
ncbi:MAG: methyl-accepting chemotaxis protein [Zoogloeaceae bacterium]|nr:MCP four helix bundle domain-containing protein [Rhodocyclaceae bacterium]MCP5237969.1 methyl-accepting chemotaxis protein [Zoogloeaceae bacterium]